MLSMALIKRRKIFILYTERTREPRVNISIFTLRSLLSITTLHLHLIVFRVYRVIVCTLHLHLVVFTLQHHLTVFTLHHIVLTHWSLIVFTHCHHMVTHCCYTVIHCRLVEHSVVALSSYSAFISMRMCSDTVSFAPSSHIHLVFILCLCFINLFTLCFCLINVFTLCLCLIVFTSCLTHVLHLNGGSPNQLCRRIVIINSMTSVCENMTVSERDTVLGRPNQNIILLHEWSTCNDTDRHIRIVIGNESIFNKKSIKEQLTTVVKESKTSKTNNA